MIAAVPEGLVAVLLWQLSHIADALTVVGLEALHNIFGDSSPFLQGAEQGERSHHPAQPQPHAAGVSPRKSCLRYLTWKLPLWVINSSSKFLLGLGIRGIRMTHTLCRRSVLEGEGRIPVLLQPVSSPHSPFHAHQQDDKDHQEQAGGNGNQDCADPKPVQLLLCAWKEQG